MAAWVILGLLATWCLVAVAVALVVGRAIGWTWGTDASDETTADPAVTRPAVALPSPRSSDVLLDLDAVEGPASAGDPGRIVEPHV